ncbi:MAG: single-stranded-DNA-specific exonuclease RecJ [Candidatus Moranbacteria bacterium GW2011_GWD2_37_9]|nr:MAG: single-stranded-DNA-specific exonuclease RecJ [Candidatus Moranbacteria bacterium GW2011_GWD2_37_9]
MNWKVFPKIEIEKKELYNLHPVALEILFRRGIKTQKEIESFLHPDYENDLSDPLEFFGMKKVVERIGQAREKKEKVLIFGDYDADGITASLVLTQVLSWLGVEAQSYIPNKELEGYGMNMAAVEKFSEEGINLIITVDCGITSIAEVARAKELGMDVIITDHHHVPENIPLAYAVINPKLKDNACDCGDLAGVGVAFKLAQALCGKFLPEKEDQLKWLLDLVAIGTVADCVSLVGENRTLVKYGLVVLSKTRRVGILELFKVGRIQIDEDNFPDTQKISFQIAPRINAAGRMDHAKIAFDQKDKRHAMRL